ncbi:MAG: hypothetical protein JWR72_1769 [Flavisolibacter sp.]|jgi:hypothetical protein|nr:hypothetical protein [Flavisolibacter sp.]
MNEDFELPVDYKGNESFFTARLLPQGYTYKIEVEIAEAKVLFEKDDQGEWRALIDPEKDTSEKIDIELLKAVVASLEAIFE